MGPGSRWLAAGAAALLLAGLAAWWGYEAGRLAMLRMATATEGVRELGPVAPPRPAPAARAPRAAPQPEAATDAAQVPPDDERPSPPEEAASPAVVALDVEVVRADGSPAEGVTVYALAEGAPGVEDHELVPNAETDAAGRCALLVPAAGVYDVGAMDFQFSTSMATSVCIPATEPLRLALPALVEVRVEDEGTPPREWSGTGDLPLSIHTAHDAPQALVPGRGQLPRASANLRRADGGPQPLLAPSGFPLDVGTWWAHASQLSVAPRRLRAPATLRLTWGAQMRCELHLGFEPAERTWPKRARLGLTFEFGPFANPESLDFPLDLDAGTPLEQLTARGLTPGAWVTRRRGRVRWSGPGIVPGEAEFEIPEGELRVAVPVSVRVEDASTESGMLRSVRVTAAPGVAVSGDIKVLAAKPDHDWDSIDDVEPGVAAPLVPDATWVMATDGGGGIAGPVRTPPAGDTELVLRRGGYLVVVPGAVRPAEAGRVSLRRADGAPLLAKDDEGDPVWAPSVPTHAGQILGPFEPGPIEFVLVVAGAPAAKLTETVRAGVYQVLRIP